MGGQHVEASSGEVIIDHQKKIATSPCYMLETSISNIAESADNVVKAILNMC